jgi:hypothetical protein
MRTLIMYVLLGIGLGATIRCNNEVSPAINIVGLVDLSSSRDSAMLDWYKWVIKTAIFPNLGKLDRITIIPVDCFSLTASTEIVSLDFSTISYGNEYNGLQGEQVENKNHQDSVQAIIARLDAAFASTISERGNFQKGTDIFNALRGAKRYLMPGARNIIILLSDMQQFSDKDSMNFEDHLNTKEEIETYLQKCESIDLIKADVLVLTGRTNEITAQKFAILQSFWEAYFKKCDAHLLDYSSEAVSVLQKTLRTN